MLYNEIKNILVNKGWFDSESEEFIWFNSEGESFAVVKIDQGKELKSLCVITPPHFFEDDLIPDIFIVAAGVNNHHSSARVSIHSHIYGNGMKEGDNMLGFEFHAPKSCLGDIEKALESAVEEILLLADDFFNEMDNSFTKKDESEEE